LLSTTNKILPFFFFFSSNENEDADLSFLFASFLNSKIIFDFLIDPSIDAFSFAVDTRILTLGLSIKISSFFWSLCVDFLSFFRFFPLCLA
jgi:hypothetical protein